MKATLSIQALFIGAAVASPFLAQRQDLVMEDPEVKTALGPPVGDAVPELDSNFDPTSVAIAAVAAVTDAPAETTDTDIGAKVKRVAAPAACTTRSFNGPQVTTPADTPDAFQAYQPFADAAHAAAEAAAIPSGYALVPDFEDLNALAKDPSYLTYVSSRLTGYNPQQCADLCDAMDGCTAFNIYFERAPLVVSPNTQVPDPNLCPASATSPSATLVKCAFYGKPIAAGQATNIGQFQGKFRVVYTGSNAYFKSSAPTVDGYDGPYSFNNGAAAINAPRPVKDHGYLRTQTFGTNVAYTPSSCAASCASQPGCVFFDGKLLFQRFNGRSLHADPCASSLHPV